MEGGGREVPGVFSEFHVQGDPSSVFYTAKDPPRTAAGCGSARAPASSSRRWRRRKTVLQTDHYKGPRCGELPISQKCEAVPLSCVSHPTEMDSVWLAIMRQIKEERDV